MTIELNRTYKIKGVAGCYDGCKIFIKSKIKDGTQYRYYGKLIDGKYASMSLAVLKDELEGVK